MNTLKDPSRVATSSNESGFEPGVEQTRYTNATANDMAAVADLYVTCFPNLASRWFVNPRHASAFYRDLFDLLRAADHRTFLVARIDGRTIGAAIVVLPQLRLARALLRERLWLRVLRRSLTGRYGYSPRVFLHALRAMVAGDRGDLGAPFENRPHLYLLAVHPDQAGRGIGRNLMRHADEACAAAGGSHQLWLYVERSNEQAIRFYQSIGFQVSSSNEHRHVMTRPIPTAAAAPA